MDSKKQEPDDTVIFVPDEIVRNINRALDNMEKARQGLIRARDEKTLREHPETDNDEQSKE